MLMRRKLIRQGRGGLTFYIPKQWTEERKLTAGDEIDVEEVENNLLISSDKRHKQKEIALSLGNESQEFIRNYLNQLYKLGYDKISISSKSASKLLLCKKFTSMFLLGFEVIEDKKGLLVLENITGPKNEKEDILLRRMFFLIRDSYNMLIDDLENKQSEHQKDVFRNTRKVTEYDNLLKRGLVTQNFAFGHQFFKWEMYSSLVLIQHHFYHIYAQSMNITDRDYLDQLFENFNGIYEAFYKNDQTSLDKLQKEANRLWVEGLTSLLADFARLQYLLCTPIIGLKTKSKEEK